MLQLMIEMAELLERLANGEQVDPKEVRAIRDGLQAMRDDMLRDRHEQTSADAAAPTK